MAETILETPILETEGLSRQFGGLLAVNGVSLSVTEGSIHSIIGPNGAGKTTLINLLSGMLMPSAGAIRYRGREITGLPAHRRSHLGIGRSFQRTNIFPVHTVRENVWLAAQSRLGNSMDLLRPATRHRRIAELTERALADCNLAGRAEATARNLSHGEQRQLEIGMILATEPSLLLLDEPMAGMSPEESNRLLDLLRRLRAGHTILLIEHDMDIVFAISDRITVMVNGQELETGTPGAIRDSAAVRGAYLGDEEIPT